MGIAAYNRGTRAICAHIDQQLKEARTVKQLPRLGPPGWFKAACAARDQRAHEEWLIEENDRRRKYGLPEYGL